MILLSFPLPLFGVNAVHSERGPLLAEGQRMGLGRAGSEVVNRCFSQQMTWAEDVAGRWVQGSGHAASEVKTPRSSHLPHGSCFFGHSPCKFLLTYPPHPPPGTPCVGSLCLQNKLLSLCNNERVYPLLTTWTFIRANTASGQHERLWSPRWSVRIQPKVKSLDILFCLGSLVTSKGVTFPWAFWNSKITTVPQYYPPTLHRHQSLEISECECWLWHMTCSVLQSPTL